MAERRVHYGVEKNLNTHVGICGWGLGVEVTRDKEKVTCKLCKKILSGKLKSVYY